MNQQPASNAKSEGRRKIKIQRIEDGRSRQVCIIVLLLLLRHPLLKRKKRSLTQSYLSLPAATGYFFETQERTYEESHGVGMLFCTLTFNQSSFALNVSSTSGHLRIHLTILLQCVCFHTSEKKGILCDCEVSVIIYNINNGKLFEYSSVPIEKALQRYAGYSGPSERRRAEKVSCSSC